MKHIDYFPSKLAKDPRFCNRKAEREALKRNIELGRHTVLVSPRRYGKSSLVHKVIADLRIPYASVDLFLAYDDKAILKRIFEAVSQAISQVVPPSRKALSVVEKYFTNFKVALHASGFGLQVTHTADAVDPVEQLFDSLKALAQLSGETEKKIIIFIDEFQDIINAKKTKSIQGAIRHVAQDTSNLIFIFSGSNRPLLSTIFDDSTNPLYMLCDKLLLERILSVDYIPYIQEAAIGKWGKEISERVFSRVFLFSELHPFYVNLLCHELWKNEHVPEVDQVMTAWEACYETEKRRTTAELEKLTVNQLNLLRALSMHPTLEPTGYQFLAEAGLSASSARVGLHTLLAKDLVYQISNKDPYLTDIIKGQFRVLDPLLGYTLRRYS